MKKTMKRMMALALAGLMAFSMAGCGKKEENSIKGERVRFILGAGSTSGDTYLAANVAVNYLNNKLDLKGKIDPIGQANALQEITTAKFADNNTMMIFHDNTWLSVVLGVYGDEYSLDNMIVGPRIAESKGSCFVVSKKAPYSNLVELADWMKDNPNEIVKVACESGGSSHLAFIGVYNWMKEDYGDDVASRLKVFVAGSTETKYQALWDGNCQMIFVDLSTAEQYTKDGVEDQIAVKVAGLLTGERIEGKEYPTFAEQGVKMGDEPFDFTKEYCIFFTKDTPQEIVDEISSAMIEIGKDENYVKELNDQGYEVHVISAEENKKHMYEKRDIFAAVLKDAPSLDTLTAQ
ncbi:tripartite tricarboxylate transporter substrate-binding protein [Clostridium sp. AM58-1XD]|uniref:tripartite tricarboxylate transporter substrate-binding protein n=1 Tax=Clostridium sp. AM58-1XD TaxID=2292307 RepID=UPI0015F719C5|nr:tripartite tricarboxylate transporter substrate-binding protein [Clostridium sp. AM58-1XD]